MANELAAAERHLELMEEALDEANMVGLKAARTRVLEYAHAHAHAAEALVAFALARQTLDGPFSEGPPPPPPVPLEPAKEFLP